MGSCLVVCKYKKGRKSILLFAIRANCISAQGSHDTKQHTFQRHKYSLSFGGLIFIKGTGSVMTLSSISSSLLASSSWSAISSGGGTYSSVVPVVIFNPSGDAPQLRTSGSPLFSHHSLSVKCGLISCSATFSGDRKAYLTKCFCMLHV